MVPLHEHLDRNRDAHDTLDARRRTCGNAGEGASRGYHPHQRGHYDISMDRSLSLGLLGP